MPPLNSNIKVLDRKEWQMMTPAPLVTAAGAHVITPGNGHRDYSMYVVSATVQYLYSHNEDGWIRVPSAALAGTFGAGACGTYSPWSITYTANGGSTTSVTVAAATHNLCGIVRGDTVEFLSAGTATGQRRKIVEVSNVGGTGNVTLTMDSPVETEILTSHTFRVTSGRFFLMSAGTTAAGSWKVFDMGSVAWQANLAHASLPATWATDGKAVCTARVASVLGNGTASSGSTTPIVDTSKNWAVDEFRGLYVLVLSGAGAGQCAKITGNTASVLTVEVPLVGGALDVSPSDSSVYQIRTLDCLASGVATSGSDTTLVNTAKSWTDSQWVNSQVRIVSGTGAGQIRVITANTSTTLTFASGATIDSTSVYEIEPCEDFIYLAGGNAVTMYRYSVSANTWTVMAPTVARGGAPTTGMGLEFVADTGNTIWADETAIRDGRYIYSVRGAAGVLIDRFDIAGGTAGAGAWAAVTYPGTETFTTGSSSFQFGKYLYMRKESTRRFFRFDIPGNFIEPLCSDTFADGVALMGQKMWVRALDPTNQVCWLYALGNTQTVLRRIGLV